MAAVLLSERDARDLNRMLNEWRRNPLALVGGRSSQGTSIDHEEILPPETYIALAPAGGIPAMTVVNVISSGSGDSTSYRPGSALCNIYRILTDKTGILFLDDTGFQRLVCNIAPIAVSPGSWISTDREKWGVWIIPWSGLTFVQCNTGSGGSGGSGGTTGTIPCVSCTGGAGVASVTITPGGITDGDCTDCNEVLDVTFTLTNNASGSCLWTSPFFDWCRSGAGSPGQSFWSLSYIDPGDGGGTRWILVFAVNGGGVQAIWEGGTSWNCISTHTFSLLPALSTTACNWPGFITVTPAPTSGTDCFAGICDDGRATTLTATVTDKVGCYTAMPDTFTLDCHAAGTGMVGYQASSGFSTPVCGFALLQPVVDWDTTTNTPYFAAVEDHVTLPDEGWTCSPFSAVFHVDDGGGNSCTVTVVE